MGYISAWMGYRNQINQSDSFDLEKVIFTLEKVEGDESATTRTFIDYICQFEQI